MSELIEVLDRCRDFSPDIRQQYGRINQAHIQDLKRLEKEKAIMQEALEFYADEENWEDFWIDCCPGKEDYYTNIKDDMGNRVGGFKAREVLAKLKRKFT